MKQLFFLLFIIFSVASCSKSTFYAYEKNGDYCTLEVTKTNDVIYRAYYGNNYNKEYTGEYRPTQEFITSNIYIYIYSLDGRVEEYISIESEFDMYLLRVDEDKFDSCFYDILDKKDSDITYVKKGKDSLDLLWTPNIKRDLLKEACYKENNITWFPPYLNRIAKINYKKFKQANIAIKDLKNPKKKYIRDTKRK